MPNFRRTLSAGLFLALSSSLYAKGSHHVKGYVKKDGTYVVPHEQTNPNGTKTDNWSTKGNTNPYTGKAGTKDPDPYYSSPKEPKNPYSTDSDKNPE